LFGKKDLTSINNQSKTLRIFEGFADYYRSKFWKNHSKNLRITSFEFRHDDFKVKNQLENYQNIELFGQ
jgi:hypothetical protein